MKKLIFFMVQFIIIGGLFFWFYLNPGSIEINWLNYQIQTSIGIFLSLLLLSLCLAFFILKILMLFLRFPQRLSGKYRLRRLHQAQENLKEVLTKYRNDEFESAHQALKVVLAEEETQFIGHYFAARIAKAQNDLTTQEQHLKKLIEISGAEALGYTELMMLKIQQGEPIELLKCAKSAAPFAKKAPKLAKLIFHVYLQNTLMSEAEDLLTYFKRKKILIQEDRSALESDFESAQMKIALNVQDKATALKKAEKAYSLYPTYEKLVIYAQLLLSQDYKKRVQKILEQAWAQHPDVRLVSLYKETLEEASPSLQFQGIEKLTQSNPSHLESLLARSQAALEAQLWGVALDHLQDYERKYPLTRRFLRLRARYAQLACHDQAAALNWLEKEEALPLTPDIARAVMSSSKSTGL